MWPSMELWCASTYSVGKYADIWDSKQLEIDLEYRKPLTTAAPPWGYSIFSNWLSSIGNVLNTEAHGSTREQKNGSKGLLHGYE